MILGKFIGELQGTCTRIPGAYNKPASDAEEEKTLKEQYAKLLEDFHILEEQKVEEADEEEDEADKPEAEPLPPLKKRHLFYSHIRQIKDSLLDQFQEEPHTYWEMNKYHRAAKMCAFHDTKTKSLADCGLDGHAVFFNAQRTLCINMMEEDQIRLVSMRKGGDLAAAFKLLFLAE